jgi:hypothetical protein
MVRENMIHKGLAHARSAWLLACSATMMLPACSAAPTALKETVAAAPTPAEVAAGCNARSVQDLVGQYASALIAEGARQRAGAVRVRMIGHDEMVTKEYDPGRLNLQLDPRGRVARVYCG